MAEEKGSIMGYRRNITLILTMDGSDDLPLKCLQLQYPEEYCSFVLLSSSAEGPAVLLWSLYSLLLKTGGYSWETDLASVLACEPVCCWQCRVICGCVTCVHQRGPVVVSYPPLFSVTPALVLRDVFFFRGVCVCCQCFSLRLGLQMYFFQCKVPKV